MVSGTAAALFQGRDELADRVDRPIKLGEIATDRVDLMGITGPCGTHGMSTKQCLGSGSCIGSDVLTDQLQGVEDRPMCGDDLVEGLVPSEGVGGNDGPVMTADHAKELGELDSRRNLVEVRETVDQEVAFAEISAPEKTRSGAARLARSESSSVSH